MDTDDPRGDEPPAVVVVGSANVDRTVRVRRLPRPGETVPGSPPAVAPGGKGLNQAVAASRMGATVALVGALGDDEDGRMLRQRLLDERVVDATTTVEAATGGALITVDDAGENTIVVTPGANGRVDADTVGAAAPLLDGAAVLLAQLEVPVDAVLAALRASSGTRILTPAPVVPLSRELLDHVDVLVPNRGELVSLTGGGDDDVDALVAAARSLAVPAVVVTLGGDGALVVRDDQVELVPAIVVDAVDTVGAGDTFSGALAAGLARGDDLLPAVELAVAAAALSVTDHGAQAAMPDGDQVRALLARGATGPQGALPTRRRAGPRDDAAGGDDAGSRPGGGRDA